MKTRSSLLFFLLSLVLLTIPSQHVYGHSAGGHVKMERCPTCDKLKQNCPYKGKHPKPQPKPTTGTLSITSTPSDASVKIDGRYLGTTPLTLDKQKAGTYKVTFSAEGYETQTKSVSVTAGKTATCSATLKKKQAPQPVVPQPSTTTTTPPASSQTITANGVSFKMICVEGASSGTFYIGETEVTQALWEAVMGSNPSNFKGTNLPVESVSWDDCKAFISKLNAITGRNFRLPKEKEWEYAAKGGNKSHGYEYSGSYEINNVAWYLSNAYYCGSYSPNYSHPDYGPHNVMTKKANELGIYDMSGNVREWCEDLYDSSGSRRVNRGGSWCDFTKNCRVLNRDGSDYRSSSSSFGLRLVL